MTLEDIITGLLILGVYMWPLAIIAGSNRSRGNEKSWWMLATVFLSWFGLVLYRFTTLSEDERRQRYQDKLRYERKKALFLKRKKLLAEKAQANVPDKLNESPNEPEAIKDPHIEDSA